MNNQKAFRAFAIGLIFICFAVTGCASSKHWGQDLDPNKKWWKEEGQSWNRKTKIFMAVGYSNPEWEDAFDLRKSSDLNARAEATSFMNSLVNNYMEEIRSKDFKVSESSVKASSKEALLGSVVVSRHFNKRKKKYYSLLKVDLGYFFEDIYKRYSEAGNESLKSLRQLENPVVERTLLEQ